MGDWKDATEGPPTRVPDAVPVRGLVRRAATADQFARRRFPAGALLDEWVDYLWTVDWEAAEPFTSTVISFPAMHVTAEWGWAGERRHGHPLPATLVHGVVSRVFRVRLSGRGSVVGARFRPGGFAAWAGVDAWRFTDRAVPADAVLTPPASQAHRELGPDLAAEDRAEAFRAVLAAFAPRAAPDRELAGLVRWMALDPTLVRVDQLADATGWTARTLQRRFRTGVGVGAKWVLARYRLQQAALALERDPEVDLAALAVRLGWYDQAHLTNDFRRMLGETPAQYAALAGRR